MNSSRFARVVAFGFLWGLFVTGVEAQDRIPAEKFFSDPAISSVQISPDGAKLAFLAPMQGRIGVALMDLDTGKVEPLVRAADENIESFLWKGNDCIVFVADVGGNEAAAIQSINLQNRRITRLLESYGENNAARQEGQWGGVESWWITNPRKIIVRGSKDKNSWWSGLYEVEVTNGKRSSVGGYTPEKNGRGIMLDNAGRIRLQLIDTRKVVAVEARLGDEMKFTRLLDLPRDWVIGQLGHETILADNETLLFVDYSKHDHGALVSWSLRTGQRVGELFVPPEGEVTGLILSNDKTALLGVHYEGDKAHVHWFDQNLKTIQANLDEAFPGMINDITGMSDDRKRLVIRSWSDVESGVRFLLDLRRPQPKLMPLGSARPDLDAKLLATMEAIRFKARDGLELSGYLTKPKGGSGPQPFIILPHGGPYGIRDSWGYDGEVQFLANRGYAVLQLNYRGSGGLGRKHLEAGRLEWGKKMQDDITDAVKWAISQGIADPKRVAIYGASYGGYAALAGVAFTPELYRCAVNYVGAVDMTVLGDRDMGGNEIANEFFYEIWIHPDMEELKRRSPVNHVAEIRVPTLHAYGENDPRVKYRQWKKLKGELEKHHKTFEVFNQGDEGHGFNNAPARMHFYLKLEEFLTKNMK
ncbi:MAG: S9 family peptidase [Opitutaceae bacterium]|nr:S9 family peptidase [Opitutaceae bacterium]